MQTFLPFADFHESAKVLDNKRLGKQRVECLQILNALMGKSKGWVNHPATRIWRGSEYWLCMYGMAICDEWIKRGFKDTVKMKIYNLLPIFPESSRRFPVCLGNETFHISHQSNLLRKDELYYRKFFPDTQLGLPYFWPL